MQDFPNGYESKPAYRNNSRDTTRDRLADHMKELHRLEDLELPPQLRGDQLQAVATMRSAGLIVAAILALADTVREAQS